MLKAQGPTIAYIQPDAAAPGMAVAVQILAHVDSIGAFGTDGIAPQGLSIQFIDPSDTQRIVVGIPVVSWQGRMIQVPFFVQPNVSTGLPVAFRVVRGVRVGNVENFYIVQPQNAIRIFGSVTLGDSALGRILTQRNTLVVRGVEIAGDPGNRGGVYVDLRDPDLSIPGNPRLLPVTILSQGPVRISNVDLHFEAMGKNGAPGGGGGGSGNEGTGGFGFTGGGSTGLATDSNIGSGSDAAVVFGGRGLTGVKGGTSDQGDQGGGGGTGHPFGRSGEAGQPINNSALGGYGGGSAGGETQDSAYGGGGGAFATSAIAGDGNGNNAGNRTGGRLLLPLAGGSGGGAGNSVSDRFPAGSGGGGGGALELVAFDSILLSNANFLAQGDSGTTGIAKTGGGGGGSGGGIVIASNTALLADRISIDVRGGKGGGGTSEGLPGGEGSAGMARFDGLDNCSNCVLPDTQRTSLSQRRLPQQTASTIVVGGHAGSSNTFTDSIRIYYRNYHTGWTRVDTVSFLLNGKRLWKKTIPALNDSLLFVSAYQKVNAPRSAQYDQEPQWISTHVSHQIVRTLSKPQILAFDTVRFPDTKVGKCADSNVRIRNLGEAVLQITSVDIPLPFKSEITSLQIAGYSDSTIKLSFCPDSVGCKDTTITLRTNAGDRTIVLRGCGIETNERVHIDPKLLIFDDTYGGDCKTDTVTIRSLGEDETNIDFTSLFPPPFFIDTAGKKTRLKQNEVETFLVTFCPTDSGLFRDTIRVRGTDSAFAVQGKGLRRILDKRDTVFNEDVCLNYAFIVEDTIFNRGNDTIVIDAIVTSSPQLLPPTVGSPVSIPPGMNRTFTFELNPSGVGSFEYLAQYRNGDDSVAIAIFRFIANQRTVSASIPDFYACAQDSNEQQLSIVNTGSRAVTVMIEDFEDKFSPIGITSFDLSPGTRDLTIRFVPNGQVGEFFDTINITIATQGCSDTTISVVLHGSGTEKTLVFSKDSLDFGEVEIGECVEDSIFITNVCGPAATIDPEQLIASSGFTASLVLPVTLQTGDGIWVVYRFCPTNEGGEPAIHRLRTNQAQDSIVDIVLSGVGKLPPDQKQIYLKLTDELIAVGSEGSTLLVLDSVRGGLLPTELSAIVKFDPALLRLMQVEALSGSIAQIDVDSLAGQIRVSLSGASLERELIRFTWLGLLGHSSIARLELSDVTTSPEARSFVLPGQIRLVDCFGLAGNITTRSVAIGLIRPQPVTDMIELFTQSQSAFPAVITVRDANGRLVIAIPTYIKEGIQNTSIPTAHLASGVYWIELRSSSSVDVQRFWK